MKKLNEFELAEIPTPVGNPSTGYGFVYLKSDGLLYRKDENGDERLVGDQAATVSEFWYTADEHGMVNDGVTDNTTALQTLLDFIATTEKNSVIYFSKPGTYFFNGPLQDTSGGNAVIMFPSATITDIQYTITLKGNVRPTFSPSVYSATPLPSATILRVGDIAKVGGGGCFLGGPLLAPFVNFIIPGLEDIIIATAEDPEISAVDFSQFTCTFIKDVAIIAGNSQDALNSVEPTHTNSFGFKQADDSHGINQRVEGTLNIFGFYNGMSVGEGAVINDVGLWACQQGLIYEFAHGASQIFRAIIGWCPVGIKVNAAHNLIIYHFSSEHYNIDGSKWFTYVVDVIDGSNLGRGHIEWATVHPGVGSVDDFNKTGGNNINTHRLGWPVTALPAGSDKQVQFNNSGALAGDAGLVWNPTGGELTVTADVVGGSTGNRAILVVNNNNSTETAISGNVGVFSYQDSTTVGTITGFLTLTANRGSGAAVGTAGFSYAGLGTGKHIGIMGRSLGGAVLAVGGYFDINSGDDYAVPSIATAALIANNANVAAPIFLAQDNGATVFTIADGGDVLATRVGIGTPGAPSEILHVYKNMDGLALMQFENPSSGGSAAAGIKITSDGGDSYLYRTSAAYSVPDSTLLQDAGGGPVILHAGGIATLYTVAGKVGVQVTSPTAYFHVKAVTTSAGTAQLKLALGGSLMTTPEAGAIEAINNHIYWTDSGGSRRQLDQQWGSFVPIEITTTTKQIVVNESYIATSNSGTQLAFLLPAAAAVGDTFSIIGKGSGGWQITQNSGQSVKQSSVTTVTGILGTVTSTSQYDSVKIVCVTANTVFVVVSGQGTFTIV